VKYW